MEHSITFHNSKGTKLVGVLSNPTNDISRPIIVMVHGHSSDKNTKNFVKLTEILKTNKIASFRFDLYGHGESEGDLADATVSEAVDDTLQAIAYVKKLGFKKIGLLGSSFGGSACIMAASRSEDLFLLVLKSPVSNYDEKHTQKDGEEFLKKWKKDGVRLYHSNRKGDMQLKYSFYQDSLNNDGYKAAPHIKIPTLIVHGDKDQTVPIEQSIKLSKLIAGSQLEIIHDADHSYTTPLHAKQMLQSISEFIISRSE